jgi:hypothetical protein
MSVDGGEGFPIEDPEDLEGKKKDLLTKDTKEELVGVLEGWDTAAGEPLNPQIAAPLDVKDPNKIRFTPLSSRDDGAHIDINILKLPEGTSAKPNQRWIVVMNDPQDEEFETQLFVSKINDGWDVEYHKGRHSEADKFDEELARNTGDEEFMRQMYPKSEAGRQQMRELGMASISDTRAKGIITVLRNAEKREMPPDSA